jgi:hypothetical protein
MSMTSLSPSQRSDDGPTVKLSRLAQRRAAPVGHGEPPAGAIGGDVDADVVFGIAPPRPAHTRARRPSL